MSMHRRLVPVSNYLPESSVPVANTPTIVEQEEAVEQQSLLDAVEAVADKTIDDILTSAYYTENLIDHQSDLFNKEQRKNRDILDNQSPATNIFDRQEWIREIAPDVFPQISSFYSRDLRDMAPRKTLPRKSNGKKVKVIQGAPMNAKGKGGVPISLTRNRAVSTNRFSGGQTYAPTRIPGSRIFSMPGNGPTKMVIERTELIGAVTGTATGVYGNTAIQIFPGNAAFSWLINFSNSFQDYSFHDLEFTYVPGCPTTSIGVVAMCFAAGFEDTTPSSVADHVNTECGVMAPVWAGSDGGAELAKFGFTSSNVVALRVPPYFLNAKYKRVTQATFTAMSTAEMNSHACGRIHIATNGTLATGAGVVGQLFCRYRISLVGSIPLGMSA